MEEQEKKYQIYDLLQGWKTDYIWEELTQEKLIEAITIFIEALKK